MSPMSWRSPSVNVIGSMANLDGLTFLRGPDLSMTHDLFSWVEIVPRSMPSSARAMSSASYPVEKSSFSLSYIIVASIVCAAIATSVAFACSMATFAASQNALTSAASFSLRLFSTNFVTCKLASYFCFYVAVLSSSTRYRECHSRGHDSNTEKIASTMAMKRILFHCCTISLCALT